MVAQNPTGNVLPSLKGAAIGSRCRDLLPAQLASNALRAAPYRKRNTSGKITTTIQNHTA